MSFFRNIRSSMTRGKNSSPRETTPVRQSRPASVTGSMSGRRDSSVDSRADSLFNRSDTFILANRESDAEDKSQSNTSTLEKKSKKFKALSKFSTFTKRKKSPTSPALENLEHHPSENATNTYYKWQSETPNTMDYDAKTDPFHFLYEQPSSLKALQSNANNNFNIDLGERRSSSNTNISYDSSTYRKAKGPTTLLRGQLEQLRTQSSVKLAELEHEDNDEAEKYKTVTLNSFRKSFRDKFLQQQNEAPHNPAWFVEVDPTIANNHPNESSESRKENRNNVLVFENENYRPESHSPLRDRKTRPSRSPVKRTETFRVDRSLTGERESSTRKAEEQPSIRIEIKNSITPNLPGRIVPVGVAKPFTTNFYNQQQQSTTTSYPSSANKVTTTVTATTANSKSYYSTSPVRSPWSKLQLTSENTQRPLGRYQTLVEIRNENNNQQTAPIVSRSSLPIRIQLGGSTSSSSVKTPTPQKRQNSNSSSSSRYIVNTTQPVQSAVNSYEYLKAANRHKSSQLAKPHHKTYFGDNAISSNNNSRITGNIYGGCNVSSGGGAPAITTVTATTPATGKLYSRPTPTSGYAMNRNYDRQQHRLAAAAVPVVQRRSRSPIKMPWR